MSKIVRAAGIIIYRFNANRFEYLLLQASYPPYHWTPPKGHVDADEDEWTAALRETKEEAGIDADSLEVHQDFVHTLQYSVNLSRYGDQATKQKTVKYWLARLTKESGIQLSSEHQKIKWLPADEAVKVTQFIEMGVLIRKAEDYLSKIRK